MFLVFFVFENRTNAWIGLNPVLSLGLFFFFFFFHVSGTYGVKLPTLHYIWLV